MQDYSKLPYIDQQDFPSVVYGKAGALRKPLRDAINTARHQAPERMAELESILETALNHIRSAPNEENVSTPAGKVRKVANSTSDDPLDSLLGPA